MRWGALTSRKDTCDDNHAQDRGHQLRADIKRRAAIAQLARDPQRKRDRRVKLRTWAEIKTQWEILLVGMYVTRIR